MKSSVEGIEISNPEKILCKKSKTKKIDIVNYYKSVAKRMLPFLEKRLLSVVRCHDEFDIEGSSFYKKHPTTDFEGLVTVNLSERKEDEYFYIENVKGLIYEAQLGTVEFHIWGAKVDSLEKPDYMVFDFDPDSHLQIKKLRQGVKHLKSILDELNLISFLKTSGGKGYHVVVPFSSTPSYEKFADFSKQVATLMESKWPKLYTTNIRKVERKGKIFVDFLRNTKAATSVAPYSLRARKGATVSLPIPWNKLDEIAPNEITISDVTKFLKLGNPWAKFFTIKQILN